MSSNWFYFIFMKAIDFCMSILYLATSLNLSFFELIMIFLGALGIPAIAKLCQIVNILGFAIRVCLCCRFFKPLFQNLKTILSLRAIPKRTLGIACWLQHIICKYSFISSLPGLMPLIDLSKRLMLLA